MITSHAPFQSVTACRMNGNELVQDDVSSSIYIFQPCFISSFQTADGGLIFFHIDSAVSDNGCYTLEDVKYDLRSFCTSRYPPVEHLHYRNSKRVSDELYIREPIPYIALMPTASILVNGGITR